LPVGISLNGENVRENRQKKTDGSHFSVSMSPPGARDKWRVALSHTARNTNNPIRNIVENLRLEPNPQKPMIALSIGEFMEQNLCSLLKHIQFVMNL
jgi:tyrosine aminotransferase